MPFFSVIECVCVCVVWIVFHLFMCMIKEAVKKLFSQLSDQWFCKGVFVCVAYLLKWDLTGGRTLRYGVVVHLG